MHKMRLLQAAEILENLKLPENAEFDMNTWGYHRGEHQPKANNYCGTTACALGWLSLDPSMRRLGLIGEWDRNGPRWKIVITYKGRGSNGRWETVDVAAEFFGIGYTQAESLFTPYGYSQKLVTPKTVAREIRELIAAG